MSNTKDNVITTPELDAQLLSKMEQTFDFELSPVTTLTNVNDTNNYTKLNLTKAEQAQISALSQQFPLAAVADSASNLYTLEFPEGLPHSLLPLRQSGHSTTIIDPTTKRFIGTASLHEVSTYIPAFLSVFTAMSVATGQYFMSVINTELSILNNKIDAILRFLYGQQKAELLSEIGFVKYAQQNFDSIVRYDEQRIATIASLQNARIVAMKDIEFYMTELENTAGTTPDNNENTFDKLVNKILQLENTLELSLQLYTTSVIMEILYSQNMETSYINYLSDELSLYMDKCAHRISTSCAGLNLRIKDAKSKKINKDELEHKLKEVSNFSISEKFLTNKKTVLDVLTSTTARVKYILNVKTGEVYRHNA